MSTEDRDEKSLFVVEAGERLGDVIDRIRQEARREAFVSVLAAAEDGDLIDVWGYDAVRRGGLWHVDETDDEVGAVERHDMTDDELAAIVCCFHSAHFPRSSS